MFQADPTWFHSGSLSLNAGSMSLYFNSVTSICSCLNGFWWLPLIILGWLPNDWYLDRVGFLGLKYFNSWSILWSFQGPMRPPTEATGMHLIWSSLKCPLEQMKLKVQSCKWDLGDKKFWAGPKYWLQETAGKLWEDCGYKRSAQITSSWKVGQHWEGLHGEEFSKGWIEWQLGVTLDLWFITLA